MKPTTSFALIVIAFLFCANLLQAQGGALTLHPTGAGQETTNLSALHDRYGFLWVGTTTGLACFDSNGNAVNGTNSGILRQTSNQRVTNIFESGDNIWFTTPTSLMTFDRSENRISRFPFKTKYNVEIASQISSFAQPSRDVTWIATQGQGLFRFNNQTNELTQDSRHGSFFTDITVGNDGFIYAASNDGEILRFDPAGEFLASFHIPGYTSARAHISLEPLNGYIWITDGSNLYNLEILTGEILHKLSVTPSSTINSIIKYDSSHLLLGTASDIRLYDTTTDRVSTIDIAYDSNSQTDRHSRLERLIRDSGGDILVIDQTGGVDILCRQSGNVRSVAVPSPFSTTNPVRALADDNRGGIWIGTDNGLNRYDIATGLLSTPAVPGLGEKGVSSLTRDGEKLWIGTIQDGLFLFDTATGSARHFVNNTDIPYSIVGDEIIDVFVSSGGATYVLTRWGICRYNPIGDEFNTLAEIGQQTEITTMAEYYDGSIWAATADNGILILRPGETRFDRFDSRALENATVTILLQGRNGTLWAATQEDGLFRYNSDRGDFERFEIPLLNDRPISALTEDSNGTLWVISGQDLIQLRGERMNEFSYSRLPSYMPGLRPAIVVDNGDIILGGNNGFQIINPKSLPTNGNDVAAYPTTITFPLMDNDEKSLERLGVNVLLYTRDRISLPYDHNSFTIHLTSTHPAEMPAVNFDYMLEGVDKGWTVGTTQSEVTYNNLRPGTYRFMVRPSGLKYAAVKTLTINVSPPWYLTVWAYIGYGLAFILLAVAVWLYIRRRVRRHYAARLESMKIQKERESWESKMRFFVDLVHEIRTPLMLISLPLEQLNKRLRDIAGNPSQLLDRSILDNEISHDRRYVGSMQTNLDYLLGITNELLDFRKVGNNNDSGLQNLARRRCDLNMLLDEVCVRFEEPMSAENKKITLHLPAQTVEACVDTAKLDRVLMNLIGNGRKYCRSMIDVSLSLDGDNAVISISDDGPGIPENERGNIFELYYQIKGDELATSLGTGLGLAYAKLIAQLHGGQIEVTHAPGGGARFVLTLPTSLESCEVEPTGEILTDTAVPAEPDGETAAANLRAKDTTVLVVDDNRELLDMIREGLEPTYNVVTACDGVDALEKLKENDIDFIVSDVMMPRMDGIELLQKVKGDINTSHIPVIILTAKTNAEARSEGMAGGADIYLDKPFSIRNLILQIENIRRTRQHFYERRRGSEPLPIVEAAEKEAVEEEKLPALNRYDREFLEKMEALMKENLSDEQFTIDILAENLNMSRSSFYRKLKALIGMTPVDYMKNYRLDAAAKMLRDGARVTEVVACVGFASTSYFAKCFKDKYGVAPRDYAK
ncbi:MAG: response regulator [Clostridium sp.]|nr:response regulator [Clostridium sp.]